MDLPYTSTRVGGRRSLIHAYSSDSGLLGGNACISKSCGHGICSIIIQGAESIHSGICVGKGSAGGFSDLELLGINANPLHSWSLVFFEIRLMTFGVLKHIATIESLGDN